MILKPNIISGAFLLLANNWQTSIINYHLIHYCIDIFSTKFFKSKPFILLFYFLSLHESLELSPKNNDAIITIFLLPEHSFNPKTRSICQRGEFTDEIQSGTKRRQRIANQLFLLEFFTLLCYLELF